MVARRSHPTPLDTSLQPPSTLELTDVDCISYALLAQECVCGVRHHLEGNGRRPDMFMVNVAITDIGRGEMETIYSIRSLLCALCAKPEFCICPAKSRSDAAVDLINYINYSISTGCESDTNLLIIVLIIRLFC